MSEIKEFNLSFDLSRRDFRALVFNLLYSADANDYDVSVCGLIDSFNRGYDLNIPSEGEVFDFVQGVINEREKLDDMLKPLFVNWKLERIGCCTRLILNMAIWEMLHKDTLPIIVVDEAIELTKAFCEKDAYKFVNGILDEAVKLYFVKAV